MGAFGAIDILVNNATIPAACGRPEKPVLANLAIKRIGRCEEDIGRTAVFLASDDSSYFTGYALNLDGGLLIDGAR